MGKVMSASRAGLRTAAVTAALVAALAGLGGIANAATPSKLPVAYQGGMAGPWAQPSVRPSALYLGADWSVTRLKWADWTQRSARGHGKYLACAGASGPCVKFLATLTLTQVKVHHHTRYFATMEITGKNRKPQWLVMSTKLGWWVQK
jgi:hypothetical protein